MQLEIPEKGAGAGLAVLAVQHIRRMRGGAQGQLMLGADGHAYVVKFQNNPQHRRVLANEFLASKLARAAGLPAPEVELVDVSQWLIENTPELEIDLGRTRVRCQPGLQFGSRFVGGLMPGQVVDYLPEEQLGEVKNLGEFAGVLALDKWTANANGRQAVFAKRQRERRYQAVFIDFGYCFHAGEWRFEDAPLRGVYYRNDVYREIGGWESFEPWLTRLETMPAGDGLGGGQRGSAGVVRRRPGGDGSAGGETAGPEKPDPGIDRDVREVGPQAISKMGGGGEKSCGRVAGRKMGLYHREGDVSGGRVP